VYFALETTLGLLLLATALIALRLKNLLAAAVTLSVFSFISALLYLVMGAVDVAFTEAVVGAGITGVLFIVVLFHTSRRSID
jgi:multicomponent Na+:H+ antiporter subunit B